MIMREIKFRVWNKDEKRFLNDVESGFFTLNDMKYDDPHIFMQYTGLKDKNGIEIYEGDVLEVVYYNHTGKNTKLIQEVYYLEESGCFCVKTVGKEVNTIEDDRNNVPLHWTSQPSTIAYLGNIHENPELLN
jgi:uncharacterized phage protein (TIGR01671 family)